MLGGEVPQKKAKGMEMKRLYRPIEIKARAEDDGVFEGYGSVFLVLDHYKDIVQPGAFSRSLEKWKGLGQLPPLLWQHQHDEPIGVYEEMREDEKGLFVRGRLLIDDIAKAREAWALLKAKAISGLSIGYAPVIEEYDRTTKINSLKEIDLWETSLVTFPANPAAVVTDVKTVRDFEEFLRDAGFSRKQACKIASHGFSPDQRDAGEDEEIAAAIRLNIKKLENMRNV